MSNCSGIAKALLGFAAGMGLIATGCSRSVNGVPTSSPDGGGEAALIIPGAGAIAGEVILSGAPPPTRPLKRGTDPLCAKGSQIDEQVLVTNGKLQNVVVQILSAARSPPPRSPIVVDQEGCTFRPRVQAAAVGQVVEVRNSDGILHNVHAYAEGRTLFNYAQPAQSGPRTFSASAPGAIKLKCDVHPWMRAYLVVGPSSYSAVTGPDGAFAIGGLADGTYLLQAWHERYGTKRSTVVVRDGVAAKLIFAYSPSDRG